MAADYDTYALGDFELKNGGTIPKAEIAYKTFGKSDSPAIIYPRYATAHSSSNASLTAASVGIQG